MRAPAGIRSVLRSATAWAALGAVLAGQAATRPARAQEQEAESLVSFPFQQAAQDMLEQLEGRRNALTALQNESARRDGWEKLARDYDALLRRFPESFARRGETYVGLREEVLRALAALPAEGKAAYRRAHDDEARILFDRAMRAGDPSPLLELLRAHPLSTLAPAALEWLGDHELERGRADLALLHYDQFLTSFAGEPSAAPRARAVEARAALAAALSGASGRLLQLAEAAGRPAANGEAADPALAALAREIAAAAAREDISLAGGEGAYAGPRGNPAGSGTAMASPGIAPRVWSYDPAPVRTQAPAFNRSMPFGNTFFPGVAPPAIQPSAAGGTVYFQDGPAVFALNAFNGGERWRRVEPFRSGGRYEDRDPRQACEVVAAENVVYATVDTPVERPPDYFSIFLVRLSHPRRRLVALDGDSGDLLWQAGGPDDPRPALRGLSFNSAPVVWGGAVYAPAVLTESDTRVFMCAFDARSGALRRRLFLCSGQQEVNMFGWPMREVFPSALVCAEGVIGVNTNLGAVAALDARTLDLLWARKYESAPVVGARDLSPVLRVDTFANCPPLIAGGVFVVAPTDCEACLAFKVATGELLWRLPRDVALPPDRARGVPADEPGATMRADLRYLAGVSAEGRVFLAGNGLIAVGLFSGKRVDGVALSAPVRGRPALTADGLYVSTPVEVARYDARNLSHKIEAVETAAAGVGGAVNLTVYDHMLLASGDAGVSAHYFDGGLIDLAQKGIARAPGDAAPWLNFGHLLAQKRRWDDAGKALSRAADLAGGDPSPRGRAVLGQARAALFNLAVARANEATVAAAAATERPAREAAYRQAAAALDGAVPYAASAGDRAALLLRKLDIFRSLARARRAEQAEAAEFDAQVGALAQALRCDHRDLRATFPEYGEVRVGLYVEVTLAADAREAGRPAEAVDHYQSVIADYPADRLGGAPRAGVFATAAIEAIVAQHGREAYAPHEAKARALIDDAVRAGADAGLRLAIERYPNSRAAAEAVVALAEMEIDQGRAAPAARRLVEFLRDQPDAHPLRARASWALFRAYDRRGALAAATLCLAEMERRAATAPAPVLLPLAGGKNADLATLVAEARRRPELSPAPPDSAEAPEMDDAPRELWRGEFGQGAFPQALPIGGPPPAGAGEEILVSAAAELLCRRASDNTALWQHHGFGSRVLEAHYFGGGLLVLARERLALLAAGGAAERWAATFPDDEIQAVAFHGGVIAVLAAPAGGRGGVRLAMLDAFTGESMWSAALPGARAQQAPLMTDRSVAVVLDSPRQVVAFDLLTSRETLRVLANPARGWMRPPMIAGGRYAILASQDDVQAWDLHEARQAWSRPAAPPAGGYGPLVEGDERGLFLFFHATPAARIISLDPATGRERWNAALPVGRGMRGMSARGGDLYLLWAVASGPGAFQQGITRYTAAGAQPVFDQALAQGRESLYYRPPLFARGRLLLLSQEVEPAPPAEAGGMRRVIFSLHVLDARTGASRFSTEVDRAAGAMAVLAVAGKKAVVTVGSRVIVYGASPPAAPAPAAAEPGK
ncbi:MAG: PQQ-binding-like beta-propeller repeat protein [Planctomycetes bacterium]|nr:PQQ-binding-like beta-propeller repeat protein [Planctomycetota bacterium]